MRIVGRNVVRIRLNSLLCMTIYNRNINIIKLYFSLTNLHPEEVTRLGSELRLPDVVLSEVKGPLIAKHIWHKGHKILAIPFLKLNHKSYIETIVTLMSEAGMMSK